MIKKALALGLAGAMIAGMTVSVSAEELSGSITGSGSSALLPLAQNAADAFKELHPDVSITLNGGGSGTGLKLSLIHIFFRENQNGCPRWRHGEENIPLSFIFFIRLSQDASDLS